MASSPCQTIYPMVVLDIFGGEDYSGFQARTCAVVGQVVDAVDAAAYQSGGANPMMLAKRSR